MDGALVYAQETPGLYAVRMAKGAVEIACKVEHAPTHDPETGEALDRSWFWTIYLEGNPAPYYQAPAVYGRILLGRPIGQAYYDWLVAHRAHMRRWHPESPEANPRKPVDWETIPTLF